MASYMWHHGGDISTDGLHYLCWVICVKWSVDINVSCVNMLGLQNVGVEHIQIKKTSVNW